MDTLDQWLAHCERQHPKTIDLGLERVQRVWQRLGAPRPGATVVTVAGTNGKGSTCAMLEAIARQAGWRTGLYSSPHLVRFEERLRLDGVPVTAGRLVPAFARVEAARGGDPLTYFEFTTLAVLLVLAEAQPDLAVLEVGLGGRLDAVNIIDADCAVITSIDLDHMEYLGPTREHIGFEKAGVMRPGRPAIVSDPAPPASLLTHAQAIGADLWQLGRDFSFSGDRQQWVWSGRGRRWAGLAYPALRGANQLLNAAGALAAIEALRPRLPVPAQAIRAGLAAVEWPGRFQIVPGRPTLVLDVAHNPHAMAALAENLDAMGFYPATHVVFGAMADKDLDAMLRRLDPLVDRWWFCDLPTPRAASAADLMARWQGLTGRRAVPAAVAPSAPEALAEAVAAAGPDDRILVCGSFFTVGGVLQAGLPKRGADHLPPAGAPPSAG